MTYQLGKPMKWDVFKSMPTDLQKSYLLGLIDKYSTTASDLAKMFGVSSPTVTKFCNSDEINIQFSAGKRMSGRQRTVFNAFLMSDINDISDADLEQKVSPKALPKEDVLSAEQATTPAKNMSMTELSLSFKGSLSMDMIYNSIASMVPSGTNVLMEIKCTFL